MRCQRITGHRRATGADVQCTSRAVWRVSDPTDPWPLSYACERDVTAVILALGGSARVTLLAPGEPTPDPRPPEDASFRSYARVTDQPKE